MHISDIWYYDETSSSSLRWKIQVRAGKNYNIIRANVGEMAGSLNSKGYYQVKYKNLYLKCHHVVYILHYGELPTDTVIDHIDGNTENNQISNLRAVKIAVNSRNRRKSSKNSSGITGVSKHGSYWKAQWYEDDKLNCKYFSIEKLGEEIAFLNACDYRKEMILKLNLKNYNYSERHGNE